MSHKWKVDETPGLDHWIVQATSNENGEVFLVGPMQRSQARTIGEQYKAVGWTVHIRYLNRPMFITD